MGKIALLVPREEMLRQAHNIIQEKKFQIDEMKVIETGRAVTEARRFIAEGVSVIIARGLQASLIKKYTSIPVVEITLTAQEMALLVMKAKQIVDKSRPVIGVIGFENMFCDMSYFDELYGIELRTYFVNHGEELPEAAQSAISDDVDLIIGGDTVVSIAKQLEIPSLFLAMTEDSLRVAFSTAEQVNYAMNAEKKSAAQIETLLDYSYNGVIQMDGKGVIHIANAFMEDLLDVKQEELSGKRIWEVFPEINEGVLEQVMREGREYPVYLEWKQISLFLVIAPVLLEERADGAIITCHRMVKKPSNVLQSKEKSRAKSSVFQFEDIVCRSPKMQECVRRARLYAVSDTPVVLCGETGTERHMLAACIHGSSERSDQPFLEVSCGGLSGQEQKELIFGEQGVVFSAEKGTMLIRNAEKLTQDNQFRLYQLVQFHTFMGLGMARMERADVRVMLTTQLPLATLAGEGVLIPELFYLLAGHEILVPAYRERPEDLKEKLERSLHECRCKYNRYHVLTGGAREVLYKYPWKGNLIQIESFCDKLILTAGKRSIDEITVKRLLDELYPEYIMYPNGEQSDGGYEKETLFVQNAEARQILELLQKYGGNRERAAEELGISKVTLWRHMKKYGLK